MEEKEALIPRALRERRLHSIMGFWLVIFLMQHLLVNSQAAYFFGDDGKGFVHAVNSIRELPYLPVIEILVLALPILVHGTWGIRYLLKAKYNSGNDTSGTVPNLSEYPKNHAYTWQRITSYLLILGILAHVVHMRFLKYPEEAKVDAKNYYMVQLQADEGLYTLSERLDVNLLNKKAVQEEKKALQVPIIADEKIEELIEKQTAKEKENFLKSLEKYPLKEGEVIAVSKDFGTAELLMVREVFKSPLMMLLYTLFVLAACFHGFNGLWTFLISWGITVTEKSRNIFLKISYGLMLLFSFLGLSAIYATYWINLRH
ncbi:MAG TPA: succinate dehydrogenase [Parachlamydiaceae bacterium]|nr:succinate dehydrogenase [Parachlamydiaceae bacterium]